MWSALFGYLKPVPQAFAERFVIILILAPWFILLEHSARKRGRQGKTALRTLIMVGLIDRLMADFLLWAAIGSILSAFYKVIDAYGYSSEKPRGPRPLMDPFWVLLGFLFAALALHFSSLSLIRYGVLLFIVSSFYGIPIQNADRTEARFHLILYLIVSELLLLSTYGLQHNNFLPLLVGGATGWMIVKFLCWRKQQATPGHSYRIRVASAATGLVAAVLTATFMMEIYFRHIYDESNLNDSLRTCQQWAARHVRTNSWGYRDREFPPLEQISNIPRVLLLGDSFAFGWGIDEYADLLGTQLQRELQKKLSPSPLVFNMGISGNNTFRETSIFLQDGRRLKPDVVVLQYHLNDITRGDLPGPNPNAALKMWRPLENSSDFFEVLNWQIFVYLWQFDPYNPLRHDVTDYGNETVFANQANAIRSLLRHIREAGAVPVAILYPFLTVPVEGQQRYALDRVCTVLSAEQVPYVDVTHVVNVNDRKFHANRFDPHPSPALNRAVVPQLAEKVAAAYRSRPATSPSP